MSMILKMMVQNLLGMLMTKTMIIWVLEFGVKQTKNSVDDNLVMLAKAMYENDNDGVKQAITNLTAVYKN